MPKIDRNDSLGSDLPIATQPTSIPFPIPRLSPPRKEAPIPSPAPSPPRKYNTRNLPWRITSDITAAACASGLIAPIITIIDRGIIENASSRSPLRTSLLTSLTTLLTHPLTFLTSKPFLLISTLYFSTYLTANTIDTLTTTLSPTTIPPQTTHSGPAKFLATTAVNMSLSLYKDSHFTKTFGPPATPAAALVPKVTYALFALRDSMTIFASFNLPPLIAPLLPLSEGVERHMSRASAAQFLAPAGIQAFSTPLHLLGLDLFNRQEGGVGCRSRARRVGRDWVGSGLMRVGRVVPAFGVGGVVNLGVRRRMMERCG